MRLAIVVLSILWLVGPAQAAWVELHNPNYGLPWCLTYGYFGTPSFLVVLHPDGATNIVGAQLRISGLPRGCGATATPSASAVVAQGDLFSSGAEIMFASPQTAPDVVLYEVTLSCPDSVLEVWAGRVTLQPDAVQPIIPNFECPVVVTTGTPAPPFACAEYTRMSDHPAWCEIAVVPTTWGAAKLLYR
jgi:hypothetical protein